MRRRLPERVRPRRDVSASLERGRGTRGRQPHYELCFDPKLEHQRPSSADPQLRAALAPYVLEAKHHLRQRGSSEGFRSRVQAEIRRRLRGHAPNIEEIAEALQLRPRTVQHWLNRDGLTFRDLLDEARKQAALQGLTQGATPAEIANALGYREVPSFYRAFRRWTGTTPMDFSSRTWRGDIDDGTRP